MDYHSMPDLTFQSFQSCRAWTSLSLGRNAAICLPKSALKYRTQEDHDWTSEDLPARPCPIKERATERITTLPARLGSPKELRCHDVKRQGEPANPNECHPHPDETNRALPAEADLA
jgi:hypothetical protein